jgi:hypothetical protein
MEEENGGILCHYAIRLDKHKYRSVFIVLRVRCVEKIIPWTSVLRLTILLAPVRTVVGRTLSGQRKLKSLSAPTVDGLWEDRRGEVCKIQQQNLVSLQSKL